MTPKVALLILILAHLLQDGRSALFHGAADVEENHILAEVIGKLSKYIDYKVKSSIQATLKGAQEDSCCENKEDQSITTAPTQGRTEGMTVRNVGAVSKLAWEILQANQNVTNPNITKNEVLPFLSTTSKFDGFEVDGIKQALTEKSRSGVTRTFSSSTGQEGSGYRNEVSPPKTTKKDDLRREEGYLSTSKNLDPRQKVTTSISTIGEAPSTTTLTPFTSTELDPNEWKEADEDKINHQSETTLISDDPKDGNREAFSTTILTPFTSTESDPSDWKKEDAVLTTAFHYTTTWRNEDPTWKVKTEDNTFASTNNRENNEDQLESITFWSSINPGEGASTAKISEQDEGQLEMSTFTSKNQLASTTHNRDGSSDSFAWRGTSSLKNLEWDRDQWESTTTWATESPFPSEGRTSSFKLKEQNEDQLDPSTFAPGKYKEIPKHQLDSTVDHESSDPFVWRDLSTIAFSSEIPRKGQGEATTEFISSESLTKELKREDKTSERADDQLLSTFSSAPKLELGMTTEFTPSELLAKENRDDKPTVSETVEDLTSFSSSKLEIALTPKLVSNKSLAWEGKVGKKTSVTSVTVEDQKASMFSSTPEIEIQPTIQFAPSKSLEKEAKDEENLPSKSFQLDLGSTTEFIPSESFANEIGDDEKTLRSFSRSNIMEPVEGQVASTSFPALHIRTTFEIARNEPKRGKDFETTVNSKMTETLEDQLTSTGSSIGSWENGGVDLKKEVEEITTASTFTGQNQLGEPPSTTRPWENDISKLQEDDEEKASSLTSKITISNVIRENDDSKGESSGEEFDPRDLLMWDGQKMEGFETILTSKLKPWLIQSREKVSSTTNSAITSATSADLGGTESSLSLETTSFVYEEEDWSVGSVTTEGKHTNGPEETPPSPFQTCTSATMNFMKTLQSLYEDKTCRTGKTVKSCKCDILIPIGKPENKIYLEENPETPDVQKLYVPIVKISKKDKSFQFTDYMKELFV